MLFCLLDPQFFNQDVRNLIVIMLPALHFPYVINSRTAIAGAVIGLLDSRFLRLEEEY